MPFTLRRTDGATLVAGKIVAIGKNYAAHAREMGGEAPAEPMWFLKPRSALVHSGGAVEIPPGIGSVHHEVELAAIVGRDVPRGSDAGTALAALWGYALFLDMTARDLQAAAKKAGNPWSLSKGIDTFAPIGEAVPPGAIDPGSLDLTLAVNGAVRQRGNTRDMAHPVGALLASVLRHVTLEAGDILATGTPEGVGPVSPGDRLEARAPGLPPLDARVVARAA
ncbi:MAG TPA: fumarylacetoacetate hydrolase family protein [Candidatus Thermoplasmatota archaeon]|nr:fumarylacetoacetate hydrolase family protein [Candidatus Thermoplasmatota archaeon]